jgi:hypothetical protein
LSNCAPTGVETPQHEHDDDHQRAADIRQPVEHVWCAVRHEGLMHLVAESIYGRNAPPYEKSPAPRPRIGKCEQEHEHAVDAGVGELVDWANTEIDLGQLRQRRERED